jgi:hypothetical protein
VAGIKWGIVLGIIAAVISIVLGVIFGVRINYIVKNAVIFLIVFFALGAGARIIINHFFPEILYISDESDPKISFEQPGSQVNITLGGTGEYAVPEMYRESRDSQELGNIEDLISGNFRTRASYEPNMPEAAPAALGRGLEGIDLKMEDDYNIGGDSFGSGSQEYTSFQEPEPSNSKPAASEKPAFTPVFGGDSDDLGALPDLGSMATAFSTGFDEMEATAMPHLADETDSSKTQYNKGNKPQPLEGDFDPQELAQGIRTVLNKDK